MKEEKINYQNLFIEKANRILACIDYLELDKSCNGNDLTYACWALKKLHIAFTETYGRDYLRDGEFEMVELPAVIYCEKSGMYALGIVSIDMESSGEHFGTFFLTRYGVIDQADIPEEIENYMHEKFPMYNYWYTPDVENDIHVDFDRMPEKVKLLLKHCRDVEMEEVNCKEMKM